MEVVGHCHIGSPLSSILPDQQQQNNQMWTTGKPARWVLKSSPAWFVSLIDRFEVDKFIVWFDRHAHSAPVLHIILKDGHTLRDQLQAWALATEVASRCVDNGADNDSANAKSVSFGERTLQDLERILDYALRSVQELFPAFLSEMPKAGWDLTAAAGGFVTGLPTTLYIGPEEDRKSK